MEGKRQERNGYRGVGGEEPRTINVDGRQLTSYCDFRLSVNLLALRKWQIVMAPDSEGDTCEQILIPIQANGLERRGKGREKRLVLLMSAVLCPSSFRKDETLHFLTQITPADLRERLMGEGAAERGKWYTFAGKMGWMKPCGSKLAQGRKSVEGDMHGTR